MNASRFLRIMFYLRKIICKFCPSHLWQFIGTIVAVGIGGYLTYYSSLSLFREQSRLEEKKTIISLYPSLKKEIREACADYLNASMRLAAAIENNIIEKLSPVAGNDEDINNFLEKYNNLSSSFSALFLFIKGYAYSKVDKKILLTMEKIKNHLNDGINKSARIVFKIEKPINNLHAECRELLQQADKKIEERIELKS